MTTILWIWAGVAFLCAMIGAGICEQKNSVGWGLALGALFGPLGILIAQGIDNRPRCTWCGGKWNLKKPTICPHCGNKIDANKPNLRGPKVVSEDEAAAYDMLKEE